MDLDARQTRNLLLAATAPLPSRYPKTGVIAIYLGNLNYRRGQRVRRKLLSVIEHGAETTIANHMVRRDVSAVYIDGQWDDGGVFRISDEPWVDNFERGEWFLLKEINGKRIRERLKLQPDDDISSRDSILRGVAFVIEGRPVLQATEVAMRAGAGSSGGGYPCCRTCCRTSWKTCCRH